MRTGVRIHCVLNSDIWISATVSSQYRESLYYDIIPDMTDYDVPSGLASSNSEYNNTNYSAYAAFSKTKYPNRGWITAGDNAACTNAYVQYMFESSHIIAWHVNGSAAAYNYNLQFTAYGSNDGKNFVEISNTYTPLYDGTTNFKYLTVEHKNVSRYKYIRWIFSCSNNGECEGYKFKVYGR